MSYDDKDLQKLFTLARHLERISHERANFVKTNSELTLEEIKILPIYLDELKAKEELTSYLEGYSYDDLLEIATMCHMGFTGRCCRKKNDDVYKGAQQFVEDFIVYNSSQPTGTSSSERLIRHLSASCQITKYLNSYFDTRIENPFKKLI